MKRAKFCVGFGILGAVLMLTAGGCPGFDSRTNNQGGGSIISAASKLAGGNLQEVTPDEIQIVTDFAIEQAGAPIDPVPDDVADAVVQFISENDLRTIQDIEALVNNPDSVVVSDDVVAVLGAFAEGQAANAAAANR